MIGRVALLITFKKLNQNHKAYHEVIYVTLPAIALPSPLHSLLHYFNHRILGLHSINGHSVDKRD